MIYVDMVSPGKTLQATIDEAVSRVGDSRLKRAQWLVDFYKSDFPSTKGEKRKKWCLEWGFFTGRLSIVYSGSVKGISKRIPDARHVDQGWRELRRKLQSLRDGKIWVERLDAKVSISLTGGELEARVEYQPYTEANAHNAEAVKVLAEAAQMLRACGNPTCERFFLRSKRQYYCSTTCRDTVNKRAYRERLRQTK